MWGIFSTTQIRNLFFFLLLPSKAVRCWCGTNTQLTEITLLTSVQLGRLISAKERAFRGMLKAYLLTQAFASQIVRKTLDLTFAVDLTFKAYSQVPLFPT